MINKRQYSTSESKTVETTNATTTILTKKYLPYKCWELQFDTVLCKNIPTYFFGTNASPVWMILDKCSDYNNAINYLEKLKIMNSQKLQHIEVINCVIHLSDSHSDIHIMFMTFPILFYTLAKITFYLLHAFTHLKMRTNDIVWCLVIDWSKLGYDWIFLNALLCNTLAKIQH